MTHLKRMLSKLGTPLLDFLYPPRCLGCEDAINAQDVLCPSCLLSVMEFPMTPEASEEHLASLAQRPPASLMYVCFELEPEGVIETCIHTMKYRNLWRIAEWFGRMLGERFIDTAMLEGDPAIIPVPLHRIKRLERGFNQAEFIARGMAMETGLPCLSDALARDRYTDSQSASKLHGDERRRNVLNAFSINVKHNPQLMTRPAILVDDVITTGATIGECASVLLEHGVPEVRLASIARPPRR